MRWFIADTHFNHHNIITYDNRPFKDIMHMENEIVGRWNKTIKSEDTVYHLGDFAFGTIELQKEIYAKLNGEKILIRGNHDGSISRCNKIGWRFVCDGLIINISGLDILLIHNPSMANAFSSVIHGHTHRSSDRHNHLCVSCNLHNYLPISEKEIIKQLNRSKT